MLVSVARPAAAEAPAVARLGAAPKAGAGLGIVRGTVVDARTAAPIAGARVMLSEISRSVLTGADGRFEFRDVAPRRYTLTVSIIGYSFSRRSIDVVANTTFEATVPLSEGTGSYQESVTVKADSTPPPETGVSSQTTLGSAALQDLRGIAADDPLRAMQALPGVTTGDDFQSQFSMRGFSFREVGTVMDGTATPLLLHEVRGEKDTGSIAMINSDVLSQASLMAGPHPLKDGDWLGPTLSFDMRDGSRDRPDVRMAVSGTSASAVLEGPIGSAKRGSWLVSIRKSYIGWLIKKIAPDIDDTLGFVDAQAKLGYDLTTRQQIHVTFVAGDAGLDLPKSTSANALRTATSTGGMLSVEWRYTRSRWLLTQRLSFIDSAFLNKGASSQEQGRGSSPSVMYRSDASWQLTPAWSAEFGAKTEGLRDQASFTNFTTTSGGLLKVRATLDSTLSTTTSDAWAQLARRTPHAGVTFGARVANDTLTHQTLSAPWLLLEGRLGTLTARASAGSSYQFPFLDQQAGASPLLVPATAVSYDAGVEQALGKSIYWQLTGWTRHNANVIRATDEDRMVNGKRVAASLFPEYASTLDGLSHGADLVVGRRSATGVSGWVAYTFAHTRFHDHATGEDFDGDYDQRHTINTFVAAKLSYRLAVNVRWRYGSNFPIVGYFSGTPDNLHLSNARNEVRLPDYSRLDLRINRTFTFNTRRLTLFLEVMNVLNHLNYGQSEGSINSTTLAVTDVATRLIPRVPSAGILIEF